MNDKLRKLLSNLETQCRSHDSADIPHARRYLNLEPATAEFVSLLIRIAGVRDVLEVGTSNGVSAIWIADALSSTGGHLTSIERDDVKHREAQANLAYVNLDRHVDLLLGDATEIIRKLTGPYDCVFFDADRITAPQQLELLLPKLTRPALLLADNVLSHPQEIAGYLAMIATLPQASSSVLAVGKGLSIVHLAG